MSILIFATSPNVTSELVRELNTGLEGFGGVLWTNSFISAAREPSQTAHRTQSPDVEFHVEHFVDMSDGDLQTLYESKYIPLHESHLGSHIGIFAVLDERSTRDKTLTIWYRLADIPDDEQEELGPEYWMSWRLAFRYAYYMFEALDEGAREVLYCDLVERKEEFTREDGIFDLAALFEID